MRQNKRNTGYTFKVPDYLELKINSNNYLGFLNLKYL